MDDIKVKLKTKGKLWSSIVEFNGVELPITGFKYFGSIDGRDEVIISMLPQHVEIDSEDADVIIRTIDRETGEPREFRVKSIERK